MGVGDACRVGDRVKEGVREMVGVRERVPVPLEAAELLAPGWDGVYVELADTDPGTEGPDDSLMDAV